MKRPFVLIFVFALALFGAVRSNAELVWTPGQGWRVEGGALAGLSGEEGRNALDLMNNARTAEDAGNRSKALKLYKRVTDRYPNSIYGAEAYFRTALLRQKRNEFSKAFDALQQVVIRYPSSEKFTQVTAEQYRIASRLMEGARPHYFGVIPGFKNPEKAIEYFEQVVHNAPYSDYAPLSLMNVARMHQKMGATEDAIDALDRMINTYPQNVLTPDAYLRLAQTHASLVDGAYYDQGSTKSSITYFEDYLIQFPGDSGAGAAEKGLNEMKTMLAQSKMIIADYYYKYRQNYKAARVFYNEAITVYPDSAVAARARKMLAVVDARLEGKNPGPLPEEPKSKQPRKKRFWLF